MKWKLAGVALAAFVATAHAQENVSEPDGYRTENYRAPVPARQIASASAVVRTRAPMSVAGTGAR